MTQPVLIDTGPLVAYLNRADNHYRWAKSQLAGLTPPLLTCEAVLAEACFLLAKYPDGYAAVLELLRRDAIRIAFSLQQEIEPISKLMARYANVPISLADASLVRMAEIFSDSPVLTLDSDFRIYRRNGRQAIPLIIPDS